jgi:2-polyprenyl-3-methyl-5-hydroxy-6-metoxy-1,4-benzoquinol methylase
VGCGFGHFVRWAADASWDAFGCDADPWAVERSEAPGRVVASLSDVKPPFDLVTLWDVLEHVAAPTSFAASLRPLIRPGGRLLVSSPNFAALQLRWAMLRRSDARFTAVLRPDEHVVQFTAQGLQCTLERAGYESVTLLDPPLSRPLPSAVDWLVRRTGRVRRGLFVEARVAA